MQTAGAHCSQRFGVAQYLLRSPQLICPICHSQRRPALLSSRFGFGKIVGVSPDNPGVPTAQAALNFAHQKQSDYRR